MLILKRDEVSTKKVNKVEDSNVCGIVRAMASPVHIISTNVVRVFVSDGNSLLTWVPSSKKISEEAITVHKMLCRLLVLNYMSSQ